MGLECEAEWSGVARGVERRGEGRGRGVGGSWEECGRSVQKRGSCVPTAQEGRGATWEGRLHGNRRRRGVGGACEQM